MKNSEEDIKIKVVMPWLKMLGFTEDELKFESSFTVVLPKFSTRVDTKKQIESSNPRLDILVTRYGQNLFVVEVKRDSEDLTDDDKRQAVQYARLVDPMAPIAVVTNGKTIKFYKVGDGTEIEKEKTKILGYKITNDLGDIRQEALEYFIGLSEENVRLFSKAQIKEGMKTLLGSKEDSTKKFIPNLYVPSKHLEKGIESFLTSDKPVFALIGESGSGKTCSMCGLATKLMNNNFLALFYKAQDLIPDLIQSISNDFNWEFSVQHDPIHLFKRLARIFKDKKIIIFVDGVDEWTNPAKIGILGKFASSIKNRNFKLVISCKSGQWRNFLEESGTPTSLYHEVFAFEGEEQGFLVRPFDEEEFHNLLKKYRAFYDFRGLFEKGVLEECRRLPFLLRIFFEVAKKTGSTHLTFSMKEFYDEYYEKVIKRLPKNDREINKGIIKGLAQIIIDENTDAVSEDALRKKLGLSAVEQIPSSLFEGNILERTSNKLNPEIGFYFKKFRDYIIAFGVKRWSELSAEEFFLEWKALAPGRITDDAITLFYQLTDDIEKKKVIDGVLRNNAEEYLDFYIQVIDNHFSNLKHGFSPHTQGAIGFLGFLDITNIRIVAYGFRPIKNGEERIKFVPVEAGFWQGKTNLHFLMGVPDIHYFGASDGFRNMDIQKVIIGSEIAGQLKNIFKKGELNENRNYYLALEKVLGILVKYQADLHGIKDEMKMEQYLPIPIEKIEFGMRLDKAKDYSFNKLIEEKIDQGSIIPDWSGSYRSFSFSMTQEDNERIEQQAKKIANDKELIDSIFYRDVKKRNIEQILSEALEIIKLRKQSIDETLLPDADAALSKRLTARDHEFYEEKTLVNIVHRFYSLFFDEYKILIEHNFPTLKDKFKLYSQMPIHCFLIVEFDEDGFWVRRFLSHNYSSERNTVYMFSNENLAWDFKNNTIKVNDQTYPLLLSGGKSGDSLLRPTQGFINVDIPLRFKVLRAMVYDQIDEELDFILKQLPTVLR